MRHLAASALLVVTALIAGPVAAQKSEWVTFRSDEGGFTILLPVQPQRTEEQVPGPAGDSGRMVLFQAVVAPEAYFIGYVDYAASFTFDNQAELKANQDNLVNTLSAKLLSSKPITLGSAPGLEFVAEKAGEFRLHGRVFVVGKRPYQFVAMVPVASASSPNIARFLDSFALTSKK